MVVSSERKTRDVSLRQAAFPAGSNYATSAVMRHRAYDGHGAGAAKATMRPTIRVIPYDAVRRELRSRRLAKADTDALSNL